jgi:hypothetical protein
VSLADALHREKQTGARRGPCCTLCQAIPALSKADREELLACLADPTMTAAGISRALRAEGIAIGTHTVLRHRKGECKGL